MKANNPVYFAISTHRKETGIAFFGSIIRTNASISLIILTTAEEVSLVGIFSNGDCINRSHCVELSVPAQRGIPLVELHDGANTSVSTTEIEAIVIT